jgi:large subunit ribosomal protein L23
MNQERLMKVLLAPHVSEKSTIVADQNNQYVFKVATDATKLEVKNAVQQMFKVDVDCVKMVNVKGKIKRFGRTEGRRGDWKKAYVTVKSGQEIDFMGGE